MRSMTGHGLGRAPLSGGGELGVELRAVNHRFLELRVRAPRELAELVPLVEQLARESLGRGRVDIALHGGGGPMRRAARLDRDRARSAYRELVELRDEVAPNEPVPLSLLAAVPDLFVAPDDAEADDELKSALRVAFAGAVDSLGGTRAIEGAALARDLRMRATSIAALCDAIALRGPLVLEAQRKRLRDRAERLKATVDIDIDVDHRRLEAEIVMFAERADITEELVRLRSHLGQMTTLLTDAASSEPRPKGPDGPSPAQPQVGRRLEFLLQEMQREANTIAAKSGDALISHGIVDMKAEIERMREQVQNVE